MVFRKPTDADIDEIEAFKAEFAADGSTMDGTGQLSRISAAEWLAAIRAAEDRSKPDSVPCLLYGLFDEEGRRLVGLIQLRLRLTGYLQDFGGHIGYCVRPTERRKGYAKAMLRCALDVCRTEGLSRVLITCLETNVGSAKTIEACDGVYEKTVYDDRNYKANMKRYWIELA